MNKKTLVSLGLLLLVITMVISFFAIVKPTPISKSTQKAATSQTTAIKVAVVNEDAGTIYNGQKINIASVLLSSFSANSHYNVETVSRSIAEAGLKNDTYQLMIVLPSKFSEETLALESKSPVRANFQYQILSDKQLVVKQAEQAVVDFKQLFNKDLINIYFTSIIGNLQNAQNQISDVVTNEKEALNTYHNNLVTPLSSYSQKFTGLSSSPNNILTTYSLFNQSLLNSNDAFTSIVDVNKTYDETLSQIKQEQDAWQLSVLTREQNLATYDKLFSKLTVEEQLNKLKAFNTYISENLSEPEIWKETTDKATAYNQDVKKLLERLKTLNTKIDTTLSEYDTKIKNAVEGSLANNDKVVNGVNQTLGSYIESLKTSMTTQIMSKWPKAYYDEAMIDSLSLSETDKQHLKNINVFMKWYSQKTGNALPQGKNLSFEKEEINHLKQLIKNEVEKKHTISVPNIEGSLETLTLKVPVGYSLNVDGYSMEDKGNGQYKINIPTNTPAGTTISYNLTVLNEQHLNVLTPVFVQADFYTAEEVKVVKEGEYDISETSETSSEDEKTPAESTEEDKNDTNIPVKDKTVTVTKTITKTSKTDTKVIKRHYASQDVISNWAYTPTDISNAIYKDVREYLQLSGLVTGFYGLDLSKGAYSVNDIVPSKDSLAALANSDDLKSIVIHLIKNTTVEALRSDLKFSDKEISEIESRLANAESLTANIGNLRTTTNDLMNQLKQLLGEASTIQKVIQEKPVFTESEKRDNTNLTTVSMSMNSDLTKLMAASRTLMTNTKSNQTTSETIQNSIQQLSAEVTSLEKDGKSLSDRVAELQNIMTSKYNSNEEFLKNFSNVLSNTKEGNAKNKAVYEYLSNPVDASKIGNVLSTTTATQPDVERQDERSGLLIILISYLISLVVAYLMQHADKEALRKHLNVTERLSWRNATSSMLFLSGIPAIAAVIIAVVSGNKLAFSVGETISFVLILILILLTMTYGINLLIESLKSLGFLISIGLLMLYIITATQLFDAYYVNSTQFLAKISPLTYLEEMVRTFINHQGSLVLPVSLLALLLVILGVANTYFYRQIKE